MEENLEKNEPIIGKNLEILEVAKTIAKEKGISADEVLEAMEVAIAKAGRTKYGYELDIVVEAKAKELAVLGWRQKHGQKNRPEMAKVKI